MKKSIVAPVKVGVAVVVSVMALAAWPAAAPEAAQAVAAFEFLTETAADVSAVCFADCTCPDGSTVQASCGGYRCQGVDEQGCTAWDENGDIVGGELCFQACAEHGGQGALTPF